MTRKRRIVVAVTAGAAVAVAAFVLMRHPHPRSSDDVSDGVATQQRPQNDWRPAPRPSPSSAPDAIEPWNATPENSPELGEGYTPAWKVAIPPRPQPPPPLPVAPPRDPQQPEPPAPTTDPVNGDRPPRPTP